MTVNPELAALICLVTISGRMVQAYVSAFTALDEVAKLHETGAFDRIEVAALTNDSRDHFAWQSFALDCRDSNLAYLRGGA